MNKLENICLDENGIKKKKLNSRERISTIKIDKERNSLMTEAGERTIDNRYLQPGETAQEMFARVAGFYADDAPQAQRLYEYFSKHYVMPATPILSNGGTDRGLPISCFLNEANDTLQSIIEIWTESAWLASSGGGVGNYWGNLRSIGENIRSGGKTSGIVPFISVTDRMSIAVSQGGSLRRGSIAAYLPVWHPEIREFLQIRKPTGGDLNRKALNIHHAVVINNEFMEAVKNGSMYYLRSPKDMSVICEVNARDLWIEILTIRLETGEPYLIFIDNVNDRMPDAYKKLGLHVKTSNLCSEIMLATGLDQHQRERTAVCCLSSLNLEYYDQWKDDEHFIHDMFCFIDNVLQDFIDRAPDSMSKARYSAFRERSVGIGVMGFAGYLQKHNIAFESDQALKENIEIFKYIKEQADKASKEIASRKGSAPDIIEAFGPDVMERFVHKLAIAPTASISIICGNASPGIEPYVANAYTQKTLAGSLAIRNKFLAQALARHGMDNDETWSKVIRNNGSVEELDFLSEHEKNVFKTAFEIDQKKMIDLAADRTPYICQSQSLNVFILADIHKKELHDIHFYAWAKGVKSLYYLRSRSIQRAENVSNSSFSDVSGTNISFNESDSCNISDGECESCQ